MALTNIRKTTDILPPRIGLCGTGGIGKSTFAASTPAPIFIASEDGTQGMDVSAFPVATQFADVLSALNDLCKEDHEYQTVVIDALDGVERLIWTQVAADQGKKSIEDVPYGKGFIFALDYWRQVLDALTWLRNHKSMMSVLIAHTDIKRFDNPMTDSYDRYIGRLHTKAFNMIYEWTDAWLFATQKVFTKTKDAGFKERTQGVGTGERVLYTEERPGWVAKNRYALPAELPLRWDALAAAISKPRTDGVRTVAAVH